MQPDDLICLCYRVSLRKLVNYARRERPARLALARVKVAEELSAPATPPSSEWTVAKVCDVYLADLHRSASPGRRGG